MSTGNGIKPVNYKRSGNPINSLNRSICIIKIVLVFLLWLTKILKKCKIGS